MSCDITHGRAEVCKDVVGGLQAIYIANFGITSADVTYDVTNTDLITSIHNITNLYKFGLKGANSFEQVINSSRDAGTSFVEQTLVVALKKQDAATHKLVKMLAYGRPHIVVRNRNNQFFLAGLERGLELTTANVSNGTAMGDMVGYNLTFVGQEKILANVLNCSTEAGLATLFSPATIDNN